jgi:hypothetical protein
VRDWKEGAWRRRRVQGSATCRQHRDLRLDFLISLALPAQETLQPHLLFIHLLYPLHQLHIIKTRPHCNMDRSLDEIISERPVWQRHTYPLACTIAHCSSSSAAVVAAVALDADPTDAPLLLPEDLAGRKVPEMASER